MPWTGRRRFRPLAVTLAAGVLLLAATLPPPGAASEHDGPWELTRITNEGTAPPTPFQAFDASGVGLFDLDGDGAHEIIAHNDNNRAYVFDGRTGALLLEIETPIPDGWAARALNGIAVGDVNGNGVPDLVIANSAGWVRAVEVTPPVADGDAWTTEVVWETFLDPTKLDPEFMEKHEHLAADWSGFAGLDGAPYLADVTGDGRDEVFVQSDDVPGHYALDANGTVRWWTDYGDGNANPVVADLTGDGRAEAVFATDGGQVFVYDAGTGGVRCVFRAQDHGSDPGSVSVAPALHDLTGDGRPEIVFGARQAVVNENETWYKEQHARYYAVDAGCEPVWNATFEWGNPHVYMRAAALDLTGNGTMDLVFQDWNTIGHKPGDWEVTGRSNLFAVDGTTGDLLWRTTTNTYWSNKDLAIADVTGDGEPEILVVAESGGEDGLTLYNLTGHRVGFMGVGTGWSVSRGPVAGDATGDGATEIVVPVHRESDGCPPPELDVGCREGAIVVFGSDRPLNVSASGIHVYNQAHDFLGKERRAATTRTAATVVPSTPGVIALTLPEDADAVDVRRPGGNWTRMEADDAGTWSAAATPRNGETWHARAFRPDGVVAYAAFTWEGEGPGAVEATVRHADGSVPVNATLVVEADGDEVTRVTVPADGVVRVDDVPPGTYTLRAESDAGMGEAHVTVGPGELVPTDVTLSESGRLRDRFLTLPVLASAAVAAAAVVAAITTNAWRRRL